MQVVSYNHNNSQDLVVVLKKLADKVANGLNLDGMVHTHSYTNGNFLIKSADENSKITKTAILSLPMIKK